MPLIQPRTVTGTLELLPHEQMIFQHMVDTIRRGYERFGFVQIETPVFELKDVLLTKSGGETEKQVYFVQSTGGLQQGHEIDLALRFDLTVPLARYVAEHERDLAFPFRRYQIQRVYRGERAQRGRFREFYQCDIDVIGKDKLGTGYDAEIPAIIVQIFEELKIGDFTIHFSNRKILRGLLNGFGITDAEKQMLVLREIDKIDKSGAGKVREAITGLGLSGDKAESLLQLISKKGSNQEILDALLAQQCSDPIFLQGLHEVRHVVDALKVLGVSDKRTKLNLAIARGLDYYTGTVYETLIDAHPEFGSVCSGGRYDDLASLYTKSKLPGVGISIGLTRLFDQLNAHKLLPFAPNCTDILIVQQDEQYQQRGQSLGTELRQAGFNVSNYWEAGKFDKKIKYAEKCGIPVLIIIAPEEQERNAVVVKDLASHTQSEVPQKELVAKLKTLLQRP